MLFRQLNRLGRHSAVYGAGLVLSRVAGLLLLPIYTRYLSAAEFGVMETLLTGAAVVITVLTAGVSSGFFRYWFDAASSSQRLRLFRTAWWFTLAASTAGLIACLSAAGAISETLFGSSRWVDVVRVAGVYVWAQMNYDQLLSLFRVEERPLAFVAANLSASATTVGATLFLLVVAKRGPAGVLGGMAAGMLTVLAVLIVLRRRDLGFVFDARLLRSMNRFGLPLVPAGMLLALLYFSDRFFLMQLAGADEVGRYGVAARIASALMLLFVGFRMAWPAFAYSIREEEEARRTYSFVLTYLVYVVAWGAVALSVLAPWLVRLVATTSFAAAADVVAPLSFAIVAWSAYSVGSIALGRTGRTGSNWLVVAGALVVDVLLNLALVPRYGLAGAAVANVCAYWTMFILMMAVAQRIYPVPYQWRRVTQIIGAAVILIALARFVEVPFPLAIVLALSFPLLLLPLGFYLEAERRRLRWITRRLVRAS